MKFEGHGVEEVVERKERARNIEIDGVAGGLHNPEHPGWTEDRVFAGPDFACIIDGAGGNRGGENAAVAAMEAVKDFMKNHEMKRGTLTPTEARPFVIQALNYANRAVRGLAERGDGATPPAAAITLTQFCRDPKGKVWAVVGQYGDTRAYLLRANGQELIQLTIDDTERIRGAGGSPDEQLRRQARLSNSSAPEDIRGRNRLIRALGDPRGEIVPEISLIEMRAGDVLGLTTDGVHDNLANDIRRNGKLSIRERLALARGNHTKRQEALDGILKDAQAVSSLSKEDALNAKPDDITAFIGVIENI